MRQLEIFKQKKHKNSTVSCSWVGSPDKKRSSTTKCDDDKIMSVVLKEWQRVHNVQAKDYQQRG